MLLHVCYIDLYVNFWNVKQLENMFLKIVYVIASSFIFVVHNSTVFGSGHFLSTMNTSKDL